MIVHDISAINIHKYPFLSTFSVFTSCFTKPKKLSSPFQDVTSEPRDGIHVCFHDFCTLAVPVVWPWTRIEAMCFVLNLEMDGNGPNMSK